MLAFQRDRSLDGSDTPFGVVEVMYPEPEHWHVDAFYALVDERLTLLKAAAPDYDRKAVFGEDPYVRFFKKFKKTYPVLLQYESVLLKDRPFPRENPITGVPFLTELETHVLTGTHDAEQVRGTVTLYTADAKVPFLGLRGDEVHTYPHDFCARDDEGIVFSMIAGADHRTCAREDSHHVFYPVFGVPGQAAEELMAVQELLGRYASVLAPEAEIRTALL